MGVKKLRKAVFHPWTTNSSIRKLTQAGKTRFIVDFSAWVHKITYVAAVNIVKGDRTTATRIALTVLDGWLTALKDAGVKRLHFVRDGADVPAKAATRAERQKAREERLTKARELVSEAGSDLSTLKKACGAAVGRELWLEQALCARSTHCSFDA
jgi:hypothetical protein